jgi:hypothetical protein
MLIALSSRLIFTVVGVTLPLGAHAADMNHTHIYNPRWPPHAKFHNAQTLAMSLLLGGLTIFLAWWPSNHVPEVVFAAAAAGSLYFISQSAAILYPNTDYFDPEFKRLTILGVPLAAAIAMVELFAVAVACWLGLRVAR